MTRKLATKSSLMLPIVAILSGCRHIPPPGPITAPPALQDPSLTYKSTLSGAGYGNLTINGSSNNGGVPFADSMISPAADAPAQVADGTTGGEVDRSCGSQGTDSTARASATFTSQP